MTGMTIGEVAKQAAVCIDTLRYYEKRGLVAKPPRTVSGYRAYPKETVQAVCFVKRTQELGFSLQEIKELLALRTKPGAKSAAVRERASAKLIDIDEKIRSLRAMRKSLAKLVDSCSGCGPVESCSILESLDKDGAR